MCNSMLARRERIKRYVAALNNLQKLRDELVAIDNHDAQATQVSRREQLKVIEVEISILRLRQSESRLLQQLFTVLIGSGIGSGLTLLIQHMLSN